MTGIVQIFLSDPDAVSFNCACDDTHDARSLADLRADLMRRLGFATQVNNPPPGMTELLNAFLRDAQAQLYRRYQALRTERFYSWVMTPGVRFYDLAGNDDPECQKRLDPYKVSWVGVQDANRTWLPLAEGIPPVYYTTARQPGIPARYEIRQCIEVFPAPDRSYTLRIKGHFGLEPFVADGDLTTLDPDAVFLFALGNAKAHYSQPDAPAIMNQALALVGGLVSGSHHTARYVPGTRREPPEPKPIFLPLEDES